MIFKPRFRYALFAIALLPHAGFAQEKEHPKPGEEHAVLKQFEGVWDSKCTCRMTGEEVTSRMVESNRIGLDGFWLLSKVSGSYQGQPFEGLCVTGYDPDKEKYVGCWIDSISPFASLSEGTYDAATKTFTMMGTMRTPQGELLETKCIDRLLEGGKREGKMLARNEEGEWVEQMSFESQRREATAAEAGFEVSSAKEKEGGEAPEAASPGPMHEELTKLAGAWNATVHYEQDGQRTALKGTERSRMGLGGFWLLTEFECPWQGGQFKGMGATGYDPITKQYVHLWIENSGPHATISRGTREGDKLVTFGMAKTHQGDQKKHRFSDELVSPDKRVATISVETDSGAYEEIMRFEYARKDD